MTAAVWAGIELTATAVALISLVVLHVRPAGVSPIDDPVSQYGITGSRLFYRAAAVALGVAGLAAAAVVALAYPPTGRSVIVALLGVFAVCRLVISWWPMDAPGRSRSATGTVHLVLAIGAFAAASLAAERLRHVTDSATHAAVAVAFWLTVVGLIGMLVTRRIGNRHRCYGAAERLIYAGIVVLLLAVGLSAV